jgi:virulence factor Mce-like protein
MRRIFNSLRHRLGGEDKTALGLLVVVTIAFLVLAVDLGLVGSLFAQGGTTVRARFNDTQQLKSGDPVRVRGVDAGQVQGLTLDPGGRTATVTMLVNKTAQPIYANARATLRWRTVLGGNYAVDLDPGAPDAGPLGSRTIPVSQTASQVEIDDVISFDQGGAKQGLRSMLKELPRAFASPSEPADALTSLAATAPSLAGALSAARGEEERDLRPLIDTAAQTVRALDTPTTTLRDVVQGAAVTMQTAATRQGALTHSINLAAAVQPTVRLTLGQLGRTLDLADPLIAQLQRPATQLAPTLAHLTPTVAAADRLLTRARPLLVSLHPAVSSLARAARQGAPLLEQLTPSIGRLSDTVLPSLAVRDPVTKLKTYELIGPVFASLDGSASTFDSDGHLFRFPAIGGERVLADELPCGTFATDPEASALATCDTLAQAFSTYTNYLSHLGQGK